MKRKEFRQGRRDHRREKMAKRLGQHQKRHKARDAVRRHAWREARLARLEDIAKAENNEKMLRRIEALRQKNNARLDQRLTKVKDDPKSADKEGGEK